MPTQTDVQKSVQEPFANQKNGIEQPQLPVESPYEPFNSQIIGANILSLGSGEIIASVAAFFGTAYAARQLGPESFGIVGFATALFGYLSLAVTAGFNDIGSREVARRPRDASSIAANVIAVRLIMAFGVLIAVAALAYFLNKPPVVKVVLLLMGLSFFPLALNVSWVYKGLERNRRVALALIISQIFYAGIIVLAVKGPGDVAVVPFAQFLGDILAAMTLVVPLFWLGQINFDWREGLRLFRSSGFLAISRLLRALMYTFDIVLIGFLIGEQAVGLYSAPYRICFLLVALAVAIHASYLPSIIRASRESEEDQIGKVAKHCLRLAAAVAAPLVVGGMIISAPLLETIFGSEYRAGAGAFRFLLLSIGFVFLHGTIHNIFLAVNRLRTEMIIFAVAAAVNVCLNIVIIRRYGIVGAAFVTAFAEGLTLILGLVIVNRIGVPFGLRPIWRPFLASAVMGAALLALGPNHSLGLYLAVGGLTYLVGLVLFRGVPHEAYPLLRWIGLPGYNSRGNLI